MPLWPGCRATKSSSSRSESAEPSGATGFPVWLHTNRHKKAPRTLRLWSFFKKPYVGIADQSSLLEGLNLCCGKLMPVGMICQGNIARNV